MNKEDEIFDDFLRSKFEGKTFENKPHYWQNAEKLIAQHRKGNSSLSPVIMGTVAVVTALVVGLILGTQNSYSGFVAENMPAPSAVNAANAPIRNKQ
jgi:hypothetical protein